MKEDYFLVELEKLLKDKKIEDIKSFFYKKEENFNGNKFELLSKKIGDLFRKEKLSKFFQLGYQNNLGLNIFNTQDNQTLTVKRKIFKFAVENERTDFIDFLLEENYFNQLDFQDVVEQTVRCEKVVKHVMDNYTDKLNKLSIQRMLSECAYMNLDSSLEIVMSANVKIVKEFDSTTMFNIALTAIENHSNKVVKKLINKKSLYHYDVNYITDQNKSLFLSAVERKNFEIVKYLTSSYTLNFHTNVAKQVEFLKEIPHFKEVYPLLILNKSLEEELNKHNLLKEFQILTLMKKLDDKLTESPNAPKLKIKKNKI